MAKKTFTEEELRTKKLKHLEYLRAKKKNSVKSKCVYCGAIYEMYVQTKCCSQSCATKLQFLNPKQLERERLLNLWDKYHTSKAKKTTYERIMTMLYREKWTSNKEVAKYELFTPNNLKI